MTNKELRKLSQRDMKGNWGSAILLLILFGIITALISRLLNTVFHLGTSIDYTQLMNQDSLDSAYLMSIFQENYQKSFLVGIITTIATMGFTLGINFAFLDAIDGKNMQIEHLIAGFQGKTGRNLGSMAIKELILSIGYKLLLIPGIIFYFVLMPLPYILKEDKDIKIMDSLKKSSKLMKGNKMRFFKLIIPYILMPLLIAILAIFLLYLAASREMIGSTIIISLLTVIAVVIASFYAKIKVQSLAAGFYRRVLAPKVNPEDSNYDYYDSYMNEEEENKNIYRNNRQRENQDQANNDDGYTEVYIDEEDED